LKRVLTKHIMPLLKAISIKKKKKKKKKLEEKLMRRPT